MNLAVKNILQGATNRQIPSFLFLSPIFLPFVQEASLDLMNSVNSNLSLCQNGSYPLPLNNPDDRGAVFLVQETYQSPEQRSIRIFHTDYRGS